MKGRPPERVVWGFGSLRLSKWLSTRAAAKHVRQGIVHEQVSRWLSGNADSFYSLKRAREKLASSSFAELLRDEAVNRGVRLFPWFRKRQVRRELRKDLRVVARKGNLFLKREKLRELSDDRAALAKTHFLEAQKLLQGAESLGRELKEAPAEKKFFKRKV
ncbi:hypothetical protein AUJ65_02385 [Candidatus Micrarchaeota archaeon CG1_02_51_15]|nr:MAG: hypothetical protein AUJ65_02385 [Candidatus Micrarchaeota archaeon CG1_02_51_15]